MDTNDGSPTSQKVCAIFSEKVTVAGFEDLYKANGLSIQLLFIIGLVLSTGFGILTSFSIIQQHLDEMAPLEIKFKDDGKIVFPNVTICTTAVGNTTATRELLVIPEKVREEMKARGVDVNAVINATIEYASLALQPRHINQTYLRYIDKVFTATAASLTGGNRNMFEIIRRATPPCWQTLSNCNFDGNIVDCCNDVVIGGHDGYICYGVPVEKISNGTIIGDKPIKFTADVQMDWRHIPYIRGDDAYDGFIVIVAQPFTITNDAPVAVAPGWHGTIKLARIRKKYDTSNCVPQSRLPKLSHVHYYDADGKMCELDVLVNTVHKIMQGAPSLGNYFPNASEGANFRQAYVGQVATSGEMDVYFESQTLGNSKYGTGNLRAAIGSFTDQCKPICQRWQYEPIVGYSEMHSRETADHNSDISWSRITVIMPSSYYEEHVEGKRSSIYVLMYNIGGAMGVCLGLSAVTLIQAVAYGCYSGYLLRKSIKEKTEKKTGRK